MLKSLICFFTLFAFSIKAEVIYTIPGSGTYPINHRVRGDGRGNVLCFWTDFRTNKVRYSYKSKTGSFEAAKDLGDRVPGEGFAVGAFDKDGNALIAWQKPDSTIAYSYRKKGNNSSFGPVKTLNASGQPTSIAVAPDNTFAFLLRSQSIFWTERPPGDDSEFIDPIDLNTVGTNFSRNSIAFDQNGDALFAFQARESEGVKTFYKPKNRKPQLIATTPVNVGVTPRTAGFGVLYDSINNRFSVLLKDENDSSFKGFLVNGSGGILSPLTKFYSTNDIAETPGAFESYNDSNSFFSWVEKPQAQPENFGVLKTGVLDTSSLLSGMPAASFTVQTVPGISSIPVALFDASTNPQTGDGLFSFNSKTNNFVSWGSQFKTTIPQIVKPAAGTVGNFNHSPITKFIEPITKVYAVVWLSDDLKFNQVIQVQLGTTTESADLILQLIQKFNRAHIQKGTRF